jgi:hypothetical protein
MRVGDLVQMRDGHLSEKDWVGVILDFHVRVDNCGDPVDRFAIVMWNSDYPEEEEYPDSLVVI